jgi:hypothetical protein
VTTLRGFRLFAVAALAVAAAGCESPPLEGEAQVDESAKAAGQPRVVVAVIDSGINPYHSFVNAPGNGPPSPIYPHGFPPSSVTPDVLREFGIDQDHILTLTRTGNPEADFAADQQLWASVRNGEPYWFRGTNIIAVGRDPYGKGGRPILPDDETPNQLHGLTTTAAVLASNPEAIIFFVEHDPETTGTDISSEEPHRIAFLNPAVDIVSTSYGLLNPAVKAFYHSFGGVVGLGKLHFSSAGNGGGLSMARDGSGPWWSIGVGGFWETRSRGSPNPADSNSFPDFVANVKGDPVPYCAFCDDEYNSALLGGTSVAVGFAAGVASAVILEARRAAGHSGGIVATDGGPAMILAPDGPVTNWQVRRALEQAAYVPKSSEYDPVWGLTYDFAAPVSDEAPWLQVAWGVLTANVENTVVDEALGFLGFGTATREKDAGFCDFQTKVIETRRAYWNEVSPVAEQWLPDYVGIVDATKGDGAPSLNYDPFVYCGSTLPALSKP